MKTLNSEHSCDRDLSRGMVTKGAHVMWVAVCLLLACNGAPTSSDAITDAPTAEAEAKDSGQSPGDLLDTDGVCVPACVNRECGDDGCAGSCGSCASGRTCSEEAVCVPDPEDCSHSCASLGMDCGEHCGEVCGECSGDQMACVAGTCACAPDCPLAACATDDGCGGTCPLCPQDVSCEGCPLVLSVVERELVNEQLVSVTVALDFLPGGNPELPGMADLRLRLDGDAKIAGVALGEALLHANKELFVDAVSGKPYRVLADGTLQLLVLSTDNNARIGTGRWLFLRVMTPPGSGGPFTLSIVEREQILAPPLADQVLWGANIDGPVVVWPEVTP